MEGVDKIIIMTSLLCTLQGTASVLLPLLVTPFVERCAAMRMRSSKVCNGQIVL